MKNQKLIFRKFISFKLLFLSMTLVVLSCRMVPPNGSQISGTNPLESKLLPVLLLKGKELGYSYSGVVIAPKTLIALVRSQDVKKINELNYFKSDNNNNTQQRFQLSAAAFDTPSRRFKGWSLVVFTWKGDTLFGQYPQLLPKILDDDENVTIVGFKDPKGEGAFHYRKSEIYMDTIFRPYIVTSLDSAYDRSVCLQGGAVFDSKNHLRGLLKDCYKNCLSIGNEIEELNDYFNWIEEVLGKIK